MHNLPRTKHETAEVLVHFFVSRSELLVLASNPTWSNENNVELGFSVLFSELESCGRLRRATYESFLLLSSSSNVLPFWCFIQVRHSKGIIIIRVFHPLGEDAARKEAEIARDLVQGVCHRANQALLLKSLHRTKLNQFSSSPMPNCRRQQKKTIEKFERWQFLQQPR